VPELWRGSQVSCLAFGNFTWEQLRYPKDPWDLQTCAGQSTKGKRGGLPHASGMRPERQEECQRSETHSYTSKADGSSGEFELLRQLLQGDPLERANNVEKGHIYTRRTRMGDKTCLVAAVTRELPFENGCQRSHVRRLSPTYSREMWSLRSTGAASQKSNSNALSSFGESDHIINQSPGFPAMCSRPT
jgi:hypothetical protein